MKALFIDQPGQAALGFTSDPSPEAVGLPETFVAAVEEVAFAGRVVYVGYAKAPVAYDTSQFVKKELDILGPRNATAGDFQAVIDLLRAGAFPVGAAVTRSCHCRRRRRRRCGSGAPIQGPSPAST